MQGEYDEMLASLTPAFFAVGDQVYITTRMFGMRINRRFATVVELDFSDNGPLMCVATENGYRVWLVADHGVHAVLR